MVAEEGLHVLESLGEAHPAWLNTLRTSLSPNQIVDVSCDSKVTGRNHKWTTLLLEGSRRIS
jgi:hypothetical protein